MEKPKHKASWIIKQIVRITFFSALGLILSLPGFVMRMLRLEVGIIRPIERRIEHTFFLSGLTEDDEYYVTIGKDTYIDHKDELFAAGVNLHAVDYDYNSPIGMVEFGNDCKLFYIENDTEHRFLNTDVIEPWYELASLRGPFLIRSDCTVRDFIAFLAEEEAREP